MQFHMQLGFQYHICISFFHCRPKTFINIQINPIVKRQTSEDYKSAALLTRVYFHGSFQHPPGSFGLVQSS